MFKRALVLFIAAILCLIAPPASKADSAAEETVSVPIVMYHSVSYAKSNDYVIPPEVLESDLKYLKECGYTSVFVRDLADFVNGGSLPAKPVVITFDDGFYNNYKYALPLLQKYGFKATVSVVGNYMEMEKGMKKRSPVYSYLNEAELNELVKSGRIELGNHTWDMHRIKGRKGIKKVSGETAETYRRKLIGDATKCHDFVKSACGVDMKVFTYPYGYYSKEAREIIGSLGYDAMLTCNEGINVLKRGSQNELKNLKRYNRPARFSTKKFFDKMNVH